MPDLRDVVALDEFEELVLAQKPATKPWEPVTDYSFEARRLVEGKHPQLIVDVFHPLGVFDVGCGPGHLVRLLRELGVPAMGGDLHVKAGDVTYDVASESPQDLYHAYFDLVICREVLEHLTVRQIRRAVTNLCRASSRWVYVTTRFHPCLDADLLDVATSDTLDPTHITLLHPDFLRALFVMEGFRRDRARERALDWQYKGRVLFYERVVEPGC